MKTEVLERIVNIINTSCKNYSASIPFDLYQYMDLKDGKLVKLESRILRISKRADETDPKSINIFEKDMDKVIFKISQRDRYFADRVASGTLSAYDVECIVRRSSFKLLNLKMSGFSLSTILSGEDK